MHYEKHGALIMETTTDYPRPLLLSEAALECLNLSPVESIVVVGSNMRARIDTACVRRGLCGVGRR